MNDLDPSVNPLGPRRQPRPPSAPRRKRLLDMTIEEIEEYLVDLEAEIESDSCGRCRRRNLLPKIDKAKARIIRLRRDNMLAEAQGDA